ncbi:MAG: OmpA family protein [Burkholderiales bacterium]
MFSDGDDNQGIVLGVVFGLIALVIGLVIGVSIYQTNPARLGHSETLLVPSATDRIALGPVVIGPSTPAAAKVAVEIASVKIYFDPSQSAMPVGANEALSILAQEVVAGRTLAIAGYYDASGAGDRNADLSRQRAANVRDLLVSLGVPPGKIEMQTLRGIAEAGTDERTRRIEVNVR